MENVQAKPTTAVWLMISVVLVALNLRPSMAAVGPLLSSIRGEVPLSFSSAALLTMLPVMAMGLAMFFGMGLAKRFGEHRSIVLSLLVIGAATLSRLFLDSAMELIVSAIAAGVGIAMIQALMPALIKSRFSDNVSLFMGLYVTAIMGGAALAAAFSPFVQVQTGSWRIGLAIWAFLALLALVFWYAQRLVLPPLPQAAAGPQESFFGNGRAWLLAIFFGLGTASYTCVLAWLAPYYVEQGWSEQDAGLLLGFLTAMEVVSGLLTPALANRSRDKRLVLGLTGYEGVYGGACALGIFSTAFDAVVTGAGQAWQIDAGRLAAHGRNSPALLRLLSRFLYVELRQLGTQAVCSHFHPLRQRVDRMAAVDHGRHAGRAQHRLHRLVGVDQRSDDRTDVQAGTQARTR